MPNSNQPDSKGKLPTVSQAAKRDVLRKLSAQSDDFDSRTQSKTKELAPTLDVSSAASRTQRAPQHVKATPSKKSVKSAKGRKIQTKHSVEDDEEFVPNQIKQNKRSNAKRKSVSDATEDGNQVKRPRVPATNSAKSDATRTTRKERSKSMTKPLSSIVSPRHPLIGRLLGSQRPAEISTTPFKKPTIPARTTQNLSTPTKPRIKPAATRRPHTPKDLRRRSHDEAYHMSSSPPVPYEADGASEWLQTGSDLEILSSNSKPVPASPNAESTAISGHADRDEVDSEKKTGDSQTAKSNPFTQRRAGRKATSFLRRLTGEDQANEDVDSSSASPHGVKIMVNGSTSSEAEALTKKSRTASPQISSRTGRLGDSDNELDASQPCQVSGTNISTNISGGEPSDMAHKPNELPKPKQCAKAQAEQFSQRRYTPPLQQGNDDGGIDHDRTKHQSPTGSVAKNETRMTRQHIEVAADVEMNDPILPANHEIFEQTPIKYTIKPFDVDTEGEILANPDDDAPLPTTYKSSPLTFPSSPPPQATPSTRSSTSADPEPRTDPPIPSDAEEAAWEASLQPHQRALHDSMMRTSKRVLRHIMDNETAVDDVVEQFTEDGEGVVSGMLGRREGDFKSLYGRMEEEKESLKKRLEGAGERLQRERDRVRRL